MEKTNKKSFGVIAILSLVIAAVCSLTSCSDDLDVQQSYPFTVEVMPYADKIAKGQTIELRFEIKPEGNYANTLYTIRYFQYDGEGSLKLVDGPVLVNNDRVLLESKTFRLNYTAKSDQQHRFLVVVEDNFNSTPWEQTFEFNGKDSGDDDSGKTLGTISSANSVTITPIAR
ncbi:MULTISPECIES: DUF3872 domain-containing protein [Muribaculaceae]|uniref:DUF3872 domain-containing protein n=1 Tax=Lepagella muris TaxID=3032870 RepID=A0AC61RKW1_9BACT|nr:DUF3872 domain-containing protein [Lepagella muris]ROT06569.1 DUF3872 domain-containing protein [Muribaculaceae bacterium Isolate-037 (Harlan)]TGY81069.1 DUF3872 domain-containing protein [Lepagella muris]THG54147.1 DUF3872 domain-containing protein [Bacteroidales bacterium]TKC57901.1 DUF3872 domain-containing protein [Bacteroidales bacterium]